jgi:hypothetical protein
MSSYARRDTTSPDIDDAETTSPEAHSYRRLSDLVAYLRSLDSVPVGTNIG